MRILVTGATGLIGKEVGKRLVLAGHEVHVVSRRPEAARQELPFPAVVHAWKGDEEPLPEEALNGVEGIVHLAGEPIAEGRWTVERKRRIRDSRVAGTSRLVEAILSREQTARALKFFVLGSAVGIYGDRGDEELSEDASDGSGFLAEVVRDWEAALQPLRDDPRTKAARISVVRTGVVLASQGGALAKMLPLFQKGVAGRLGSGRQYMPWIHIDDIAELFVHCAMNAKASGVFNGVAPEATRNDRFTEVFAKALGGRPFMPVPAAALKIAYGEMAIALLGSQNVVGRRALESGFNFKFARLEDALSSLLEPFRGGQHELCVEQWVPKPPEEVFPYFSSEKNLEALTPPFLSFSVTGKSTDEIKQGTLIDYRLSLHGFPLKWKTLIESWDPGRSFVDTQLKGPYKKWHHTHEFVPFAGGTLLRDRVLYRLPMGWLGDVSASWKVSRDVSTIFAYRRKKIEELFGS